MEQLHNQITSLIQHGTSEGKVSVSEVVLLLEMIKLDLISQVTAQKYTKVPVNGIKVVPKPKKTKEN